MRLMYLRKTKNSPFLSDIKNLLIVCDREFVPPLSERKSTTQSDLTGHNTESSGMDSYFDEISEQSTIVAVENGRAVAFMSFRENYVCEHISGQFLPNLYVTTVIVHLDYRHRSIAGFMYDFLMKKFPKKYLLTRTWSTNLSHIRILISRGFHEHCVLADDRGENIDTNYFCRKPEKVSFSQRIKRYRLGGDLVFCGLLAVITVFLIILWSFCDDDLMHELALAMATSLMASFLCLVSDIFLKIREAKKDRFINKLKSFGIENLQFNKNELLESVIPGCRDEIWISGYRLIMTGKATFRQALITACQRSRHLKIRLLIVPCWSMAYSMVYGTEDVTMNYINVIRDLAICREKYHTDLEIHFSEKPIFSDTYKVDDRFITGPYFHCADSYNNRITAKDFFSFDIISEKTELYQVFYNDYMTIWNEADCALDIDLFCEKVMHIDNIAEYNAQERSKLLQSCTVSLPSASVLANAHPSKT